MIEKTARIFFISNLRYRRLSNESAHVNAGKFLIVQQIYTWRVKPSGQIDIYMSWEIVILTRFRHFCNDCSGWNFAS